MAADQDLVQATLSGETEAFGSLVERYQAPVYNLCYRMLSDPAEAEDAAQEVFIKAFGNMKRYDPDRKFINWILTIASILAGTFGRGRGF